MVLRMISSIMTKNGKQKKKDIRQEETDLLMANILKDTLN